jgi:hypothetical protein
MIDGGSNICMTGDLGSLLDVVDIDPITILVALEGSLTSYDNCITKRGLLPLPLSNGTTYYQPCFYCTNMVETIISPAAVLASSEVFYSWTQEGFRDPTIPGSIWFSSHDGLVSMHFPLSCIDGLYYCKTVFYMVNQNPVRVHHTKTASSGPTLHRPLLRFTPTTRAQQVETEVWALRFGSPGEHQLDILPRHVEGIPLVFKYHPFCSIDFKKQAYIRKQPAQKTAERIPGCGAKLFMDFGFLRASTEDYKCPNKALDRIVCLYDRFCAYLLIVDSASRRVWAFLTETKEPPLAILRAFMTKFGIANGVIRTDQGGKLAWSADFRMAMLQEFDYVIKPTGADSPCQNGGAEIYNNTLAVKV